MTTSPTTIATVAGEAEKVVEAVMKVEPTVATIAGMFNPGAAPIAAMVQPMILAAAPFVEQALNDLAAGNNGNFMESFIQLLQHLSPAHPNSPILGGGDKVTAG
jgi:hypothetical protein